MARPPTVSGDKAALTPEQAHLIESIALAFRITPADAVAEMVGDYHNKKVPPKPKMRSADGAAVVNGSATVRQSVGG